MGWAWSCPSGLGPTEEGVPGEGPRQPSLSALAGERAQDPNLYPAGLTELLPCWGGQPVGSCCSQGAHSQLRKVAGPGQHQPRERSGGPGVQPLDPYCLGPSFSSDNPNCATEVGC